MPAVTGPTKPELWDEPVWDENDVTEPPPPPIQVQDDLPTPEPAAEPESAPPPPPVDDLVVDARQQPPRPVEPPPPVAAQEAAAKPPATKRTLTQAEAMRAALAELGLGASNSNLAAFLRDKYGLEPKNIAVLKSSVKKALLKKQTEQPRQEAVPAEAPALVNGALVLDEPRPATEIITATPTTDQEEPEKPHGELGRMSSSNGVAKHRQVVIPYQPVSPSPLPSHAADQVAATQLQEEPHLEHVEPEAGEFRFSIEQVWEVKELCDRIGAETVIELLDILGL